MMWGRGSGLLIAITLGAWAAAAVPASAQTRAPAPKPRATGTKTPEAKPTEAKTDGKVARSTSPIVIDADRMEAIKKDGLVIFTGNVVAKQDNSTQTADRMEVYLDERGDRVLRMVSTGNVKIVTEDCRTGTAKRAEYYDDEQRLLLIGDAKVWQDENVVSGEQIEIFLAEERSTVKGGSRERVKSVFYPKRAEEGEGGARVSSSRQEKRGAPCG
jgi:lipopolysaccharide export system protein LptA